MTYTNGAGHNNVEQLLQSIRSSIGDNPLRSQARSFGGMNGASSPVTSNPVMGRTDARQAGAGNADGMLGPNNAGRIGVEALRADLMARHEAARPDLPVVDDSAEFELPAIFKAQATPVETSAERSHLLDRLSDVLLTTTDAPPTAAEPARDAELRDSGRTIIRFEPANASRDTRQAREPHGGDRSMDATSVDGRGSNAGSGEQLDRITKDNDSVKRVMPTFFDTRMKMLSQPSAPPPVAAEPVETYAPPVAATPPPVPHYETHPLPPTLPMPSRALTIPSDTGTDPGMDDMAAQMLRPILREWLSENMPKLVERALRSEMGGSGPAVSNDAGSKPKG